MKTIAFTSIFTICITIFSCTYENIENVNKTISTQTEIQNKNLNLKKKFSFALVNILKEHEDVRTLIKQEGLKKIDFDYDVLYKLIKNKKLRNNKSIEELFSKYLTTEELSYINNYLPTLTIFIPSLPEDMFSAEKWDVKNEIPAVATKISQNNDILIYHITGEEEIIPKNYIPGFPVLVIKENERIVAGISTRSQNGNILKSENNIPLKFLDQTFDNISPNFIQNKNLNITLNTRNPNDRISLDTASYLTTNMKKHIEAYNIYPDWSGWQRDNIYYSISPTRSKGPFNYDYKECLIGFEMLGDGVNDYKKIADQNEDPKTKIGARYNFPIINWTDGEFEFKVKVYLGNKNAFGNELVTYFRVKPDDLFSSEFKIIRNGVRPGSSLYELTGLKPKLVKLTLPLFEWNLESYSSNIKIAIEEVDSQETTVQTTTTTSEFATNFGFDASWGDIVKLGAKFGTSAKETRTVSFQISKSQGNDELGEVIINFADPILTDDKIKLVRRGIRGEYDAWLSYNIKYSTGWYRIYVAPQIVK